MYILLGILVVVDVVVIWACLKVASDYDDRNGM